MVTAIIADDEDLPRKELRRMLAELWPELIIVAESEHGADALEAIYLHTPDIAFLDIRMPGMSGLDVANAINPPGDRQSQWHARVQSKWQSVRRPKC